MFSTCLSLPLKRVATKSNRAKSDWQKKSFTRQSCFHEKTRVFSPTDPRDFPFRFSNALLNFECCLELDATLSRWVCCTLALDKTRKRGRSKIIANIGNCSLENKLENFRRNKFVAFQKWCLLKEKSDQHKIVLSIHWNILFMTRNRMGPHISGGLEIAAKKMLVRIKFSPTRWRKHRWIS